MRIICEHVETGAGQSWNRNRKSDARDRGTCPGIICSHSSTPKPSKSLRHRWFHTRAAKSDRFGTLSCSPPARRVAARARVLSFGLHGCHSTTGPLASHRRCSIQYWQRSHLGHIDTQCAEHRSRTITHTHIRTDAKRQSPYWNAYIYKHK